jgi:hypothetical protein
MSTINYGYVKQDAVRDIPRIEIKFLPADSLSGFYVGWNFNSGNYLFTTDTK